MFSSTHSKPAVFVVGIVCAGLAACGPKPDVDEPRPMLPGADLELVDEDVDTLASVYDFLDIDVDGDGTRYVVASRNSREPAGTSENVLVKLDGGRADWTTPLADRNGLRAPASTSDSDVRRPALSVDSSGNAFIGGHTCVETDHEVSTCSDAFLTKFDAQGEQQWTRVFGGPLADGVTGVTANAAGGVFAVGSGHPNNDKTTDKPWGGYVVHYDNDGTRNWVHRIDTPTQNSATDIAMVGDGILVVTGWEPETNRGYWLTINDRGGALEKRTFDFGNGIEPTHVHPTSKGNFVVAGTIHETYRGVAVAAPSNKFVAKLNRQGALHWSIRPELPPKPRITDLEFGHGGTTFLVGDSTKKGSDGGEEFKQNAFVTAIGQEGDQQWLGVGLTPKHDDYCSAAAVGTDGDLILVGQTTENTAVETTNLALVPYIYHFR